ncbi:MAG: cytochrome-c peroxidase [Proteobacteria bacterium]|nr:cytochrome-c peroxidase [Pseudomonadota bacterium]
MNFAVKSIVFIALGATGLNAYGALPSLPKVAPSPKDNPTTPAKVELGKKLFFDPRLSKDGTVSCNSCHNVMSGGEDSRPNSVGINGQKGGRSSPTVWNAAFLSVQFWDGRAASLEDQAKGPLTNPIEMGMESHDVVIERVKQIPGYVTEFGKVFPGKDSVTIDNLAKAIAAYERTLITPDNAYDKFVKGNKKALSPDAQRGLKTAQEVGCLSCHSGPAFAGPDLPVGVGNFQKFPALAGSPYETKYKITEDLGRFNVTKQESDKNMWRVPTWRNVAVTAPYFHNGSVETLEEAVKVMASTQLGKTLPENDVKDIVAFLESLTGPFPKQIAPMLPKTAGRSVIK